MGSRDNMVDAAAKRIEVSTRSGKTFCLKPVAMPRMPSEQAGDWLKFQGAHVAGSELSEGALARLQMFMRAHKTEALSDGERTYTIAGGMLAYCNPDSIV